MWFNSKQREEPYQGLTSSDNSRDRASLRGRETGGAWLSSARVVRCLVKSNNERNPCCQLPSFSWELWRDCRGQRGGRRGRRQIIMPLMSWATHVIQWQRQRAANPRGQANPQTLSQFGLQAATRLHEVGIASNGRSAYCREYVPGPCTHRPSHHESLQYPKSVA